MLPVQSGPRISRRAMLLGAAGTVGAAGVGSFTGPLASAVAHEPSEGPVPAPKPIPGGLQIPGGPFIHIFLPGPTDVTLPFSGSTLMGLDVEPSTITDFKGAVAVGMVIGTATGSDGKTYNLEVDIRGFDGQYLDANGTRQRDSFALI